MSLATVNLIPFGAEPYLLVALARPVERAVVLSQDFLQLGREARHPELVRFVAGDIVDLPTHVEVNVIAVGVPVRIEQLGDHQAQLRDQGVEGGRLSGEAGDIVAGSDPDLRGFVPHGADDQRLWSVHGSSYYGASGKLYRPK